MKTTVITASLLLAALSAKPIGFTSIDYTGDWRDGISVSWVGDNVNTSQQELFSNRYVFVQQSTEGIGEIPDPLVSMNIGVSFDSEPGPLEVDLQLGFLYESGEIFHDQYHIPDGYTATSVLDYDPETGNGSLSWTFEQTNVPDAACSLGLLALGVIVLARFRRN